MARGFAVGQGRSVRIGLLYRKAEWARPVLDTRSDGKPSVPKDVEHGAVLTKCLGPESCDPSFSGRPSQLVEQQCADPVMLVLVGHYERHLSFRVPWLAVKATYRNYAVVKLGYQCQPIDVVDTSESLYLFGRQLGMKGKEPQIDRSRQQVMRS